LAAKISRVREKIPIEHSSLIALLEFLFAGSVPKIR
jgi:hypothetical protein